MTGQLTNQPVEIPIPPVVQKKSNLPLIIGGVLVLLFVIVGSIYAGMKIGEKKQGIVTPNLIINTKPTAAPSVGEVKPTETTDETAVWKSYTHTKFADLPNWKIPWSGFTLYYPDSWEIEESKQEASSTNPTPSLSLKLSKTNRDYFEIIQGQGGGGYCLFPDDPNYQTFDGMGQKFSKYFEINKGNQIVWRLATYLTPSDLWTHTLCEKINNVNNIANYKDGTIIGFTKIKVITAENLAELKQILQKIEIAQTNNVSENDKQVLIDYLKAKFAQELTPKGKPDDIVINVQKLEGVFAMGTYGLTRLDGGGGAVWIAKKIDGKWSQIWGGQEGPLCSDIEKYQVPTSITPCN